MRTSTAWPGQRVDRKFELGAKLREVYEAWTCKTITSLEAQLPVQWAAVAGASY